MEPRRIELGERLDDRGPRRERPWRRLKRQSRAVSASMARIADKIDGQCGGMHEAGDEGEGYFSLAAEGHSIYKRANLMYSCADVLGYVDYIDPDTGEAGRRLQSAGFCRDRLCPMCNWRKSLVMFGQISEVMDAIERDHPDLRPIFLTVTQENSDFDKLAEGVDGIIKAWSRMTRKAYNPWFGERFVGWFRTVEVTYNAKTKTWHVHIHAVLLVDKSYFDKDNPAYIDHDGWIKLWRKALKVDYDPSVDVRTFHGDRAKGVAEVAKYAIKPGDWVSDDYDESDACIYQLAGALKGRRLTVFNGLMQEYRKRLKMADVESADLVDTGTAEGDKGGIITSLDVFEWSDEASDYICTRKQSFDVSDRVPPPTRDGPPGDGPG